MSTIIGRSYDLTGEGQRRKIYCSKGTIVRQEPITSELSTFHHNRKQSPPVARGLRHCSQSTRNLFKTLIASLYSYRCCKRSLQKLEEIVLMLFNDAGNPLKKDAIQLLSNIPSMTAKELPWYNHHKETFSKNNMFKTFCTSQEVIKKAKWVLCNWFQSLAPLSSATTSLPNTISIGPLLANMQQNKSLYPEDSIILSWLDRQPLKSVIYVAFGSILSPTQTQLAELAHGLELTGRRFLWAVRADMASHSVVKLPDGFEERIANCGKLVEWASQEKVWAHPSVACFLTHCGWNSAMEGLSYGVPLLCWPCFADQFFTRTCICDAWKIGLSLVTEKNGGTIPANDVRAKIDELLSREDLRENSLKFKERVRMSISKVGASFAAIDSFMIYRPSGGPKGGDSNIKQKRHIIRNIDDSI